MGAPYDNIPGVDSSDNFHPDIREALLASEQFVDLKSGRLAPTATQTTDWNTATKNGWYYSVPGAPNSPGASYAIGQVIATPSAVTQEAFEYTTDGSSDTKAYRRDYQGSTWTAWYRIRMSEAELDVRYWQTSVTELGQEDLNTVLTPGDYHQSQNADAAAAANYPRADAGFLTVRASTSNFVYQEYSTYQASTMRYWRAKYNSNWSVWREIQPVIAAGTTAQYFRGDKTWQTLNKAAVGLSVVDNVSVVADYVPRWKASTVYTAGQQVLNPYEEIVESKTARTSGTTYNAAEAANWRGFDQIMAFSSTGFAWSGGSVAWDAGPLSPDVSAAASSQVSSGASFASAGSLSGTIKFLEPGIYDVIWDNYTSADPGTSGYRINFSGTWPGPLDNPNGVFGVGNRMSGQTYWETKIHAIGIRVPQANLEIRLVGLQSNATTNIPRVKVIKRASV